VPTQLVFGARNVGRVLVERGGVIESEKTAEWLKGEPPEQSGDMGEIVRAIRDLHWRSPRAWTRELALTPVLETWVQ
jgi:hypothetical protein